MAQPTALNDAKHCFTRELVEQLKARTSVKHGPHTKSTLFIFIWESPSLAQTYKITYLVRVEADGEEALGFRFDDVKSQTPKEIAWGGMVGTARSPRCFLDGSQTFLTDSISKASERCQRGWHVRIGKVSEMLNLLEATQDSLVMKLSLRKPNSKTRVTDLVFRTPVSTALEGGFQDTFQSDRLHVNHALRQPASSASSTILPSNKSPREIPSFSHPSIRHKPPKPTTPSSLLTHSTHGPTSHELLGNAEIDSKPSMSNFFSSSSQNTQSPPRKRSLRKISLAISSMPTAPPMLFSRAQSSPQALMCDVTTPLPQTPPQTPLFPYCQSLAQQASAPSHGPSHFLTSIEPPCNLVQAPVIGHSLSLDAVPKQNSPGAKTNSLQISTIPTENLSAHPSYSRTVLVKAPQEMVCFVFPPSTKRLNERKLYIPYHDLMKVDYFKQALKSSNYQLSIDERPSKKNPPFKAVKRIVITSIVFFVRKALELPCACTQLHPKWVSHFKIRDADLSVQLIVALSKIAFGLAGLIWKTTLEAMELIFDELYAIVNGLTPQDSPDTEETQAPIFSRILISLKNGLKLFCRAGSLARRFLVGDHYCDEDSDDELESLLGQDDLVEPTSINLKTTFTINHIGYPSFCALSNYLQQRTIHFAPLRSSFEAQKNLACELSKNPSISGVSREFPLDYQKFIKMRSVKAFQGDDSHPGLSLTPCSPKSLYMLADKLRLEDLKELARQQIMLGLSPLNIVRELKHASIYNYKELLVEYQSTVKSFLAL